MRTWTAQELRTFLDGVSADRLAGAWWLLATTGMRRGEVLGLRWEDVDFDAGVLRISRTLITTDVQRKGMPGMAWGTPKTGKGRRQVALDAPTVAALRLHRSRQLHERLSFAGAYEDTDLVISREDGHPLHPKALSYRFERWVTQLKLPRIRLHDLRHTQSAGRCCSVSKTPRSIMWPLLRSSPGTCQSE